MNYILIFCCILIIFIIIVGVDIAFKAGRIYELRKIIKELIK